MRLNWQLEDDDPDDLNAFSWFLSCLAGRLEAQVVALERAVRDVQGVQEVQVRLPNPPGAIVCDMVAKLLEAGPLRLCALHRALQEQGYHGTSKQLRQILHYHMTHGFQEIRRIRTGVYALTRTPRP